MKHVKSILAGLCLAAGLSTGQASASGESYIGQLNLYSGTFCPRGTAEASGQLLPISQHQALFSILGTTYGGDGRTSFALPDLRGRTAIGPSDQYRLGQKPGQETVTMTVANLPAHTHVVNTTTTTNSSNSAAGALLGEIPGSRNYYYSGPEPASSSMNNAVIGNTGGNQPIANMQPYTVMRWCITMEGLFPPRN